MEIEAKSKDLKHIWQAAPHWAALIVVVITFIVYLDRHETREQTRMDQMDKIADIRIKQCHDIQVESTEAMKRLTETLHKQTLTFEKMTAAIEHHERSRLLNRSN